MRIFEAHDFLRIAQDLTRLAEQIGEDELALVEGDWKDATVILLNDNRQRCLAMGLQVSAEALQEAETSIGSGVVKWEELRARAKAIVDVLRFELSTVTLFGIDAGDGRCPDSC